MGHAHPRKLFTLLLTLGIGALAMAMTGCTPSTVQVVTSPGFHASSIPPIAIFPFTVESSAAGNQKFPLSTSQVSSQAIVTVTELFYKNLRKKHDLAIIPMERVTASLDDLDLVHVDNNPPYATERKIGAALEAKTILVGTVSQYRERAGSAFGGQPASVGFEARLVTVHDAKTLWVGHFFETQRPMTSDLKGFLERRRWLTAQELADDGIKQLLEKGWE